MLQNVRIDQIRLTGLVRTVALVMQSNANGLLRAAGLTYTEIGFGRTTPDLRHTYTFS